MEEGSVGRRLHFSCVTGSTSYGNLETGIPSSISAKERKVNKGKRGSSF